MTEYIALAVVAALVFGGCFLIDKGFVRVFRNQQQHRSGKAVRLNKRYGTVGLVMTILGIVCMFAAPSQGVIMWIAGGILILGGAALVTWYLSFGVFYDKEAFIVTNFGKKSTRYTYDAIVSQQLYNSYGNIIVELHLHNGKTVQLQSTMGGTYEFLDFAFHRWLEATGRKEEDCPFYQPDQSCWFPPVEEE